MANMTKDRAISPRKLLFADKLRSLLDEYDTCLIIEINNIGSKQIAEMRQKFHDKQTRFLFGKNTLIRKVIRDYIKQTRNMKLKNLMDLIKGNVGLVFTKQDIQETYKDLIKIRQQCQAKINAIAPCDVHIDIGPTNVEPTKTGLFQSMDIETRINRGQIDIISPKLLIKKGEKVNASHTFILSILNIKPFWYGIKVNSIYDCGEKIEDTSYMDMTMDEIQDSFYLGLSQISAFCLSLNYPTMITIPHSLLNAYRQTVGLSMMLENYSWDGLDAIQNILEYAFLNEDNNGIEQPQITQNADDANDSNDGDSDDGYHGPFCQCSACGGSSSDESSEDESSES